MCVHFDKVCVSNLILVDHDGKVMGGDYAIGRFVLHANVHAEHPDGIAMPCHTSMARHGQQLAGRLTRSRRMPVHFEDHVVIGDEAGAVAVENHAGSNVGVCRRKAAIRRITGC